MVLDDFEVTKHEFCTSYYNPYEDIHLLEGFNGVDVWVSGEFLFECRTLEIALEKLK